MARSSSIWIVLDEGRELRAAFTVRHEAVSWLTRHSNVDGWIVVRFSDGSFVGNGVQVRTIYPVNEFLA
jgi:hypothetical protein